MPDTSRSDSAVHFSIATIAGVAGWTTSRTRIWFRRQGLATKFGGRWVVTAATLRSAWPTLAERMIDALAAPTAPVKDGEICHDGVKVAEFVLGTPFEGQGQPPAEFDGGHVPGDPPSYAALRAKCNCADLSAVIPIAAVGRATKFQAWCPECKRTGDLHDAVEQAKAERDKWPRAQ